ncbi:MAG: malate dehydrogenase [Oligoflexales bacterium]
MKEVRVAVTGAAGQIGYSLLFRLASGEVFGNQTKVHLNLLELPQAVKAAEGTALELSDCAFPLLGEVNCYDNAAEAFSGANWVLMVGSMPRSKGMERSDLIRANGPIFVEQGKAILRAAEDVRAVVVGNPCNTNALIALHHCRDVPPTRFSAMTALDENRAKAQLSLKAGCPVSDIKQLAVWGNHSPTMYPDFENALIGGKSVESVITDRSWLENDFMTTVQKRGAEIIQVRGKSSAASAASACLDHVRRYITPTPAGDWFSAAIPSNGSAYGVPGGLVFSFPVRSKGDGELEIVENLKVSDYARAKIEATTQELQEERDVIKDLLG